MSNVSSEAAPQASRPWPWHPAQTVLLTLAVFILSQFGALLIVLALATLVASYFGVVAGLLADGSASAQFLTVLAVESLAVYGTYAVLKRRGLRLRDIGLSRPRLADAVWPLLAFIAYLALFLTAVVAVQSLVPGLDTDQKQDIGFDNVSGTGQLALVFAALVILAPVAEEVLFRGLLFTGLRSRLGLVAATAVTSLLFGAAHLLGGEPGASLLWIAGIDTLILSVVLCYLREKTGRLWAPIGLHALKNGLAFMLLFAVPDWGGRFAAALFG